MTTVFEKRKITSSCGSHDVEVVESPHVDLISDLPDCVMSQILSRLPTKDALRTSVLSRDWKNKWTSIYDIDINDECPIDTDSDEYAFTTDSSSEGLTDSEDECEPLPVKDRFAIFRSYVEKVVDSTHNLSIRSFRLVLGDTSHDSNHLQELMPKILCRGVDNLSIVTRGCQGKTSLPSCLGRHTFLSKLKLSLNCTLKIRNINCYPKLKSLYLCGRGGIFRIANRQSNVTGHLSLTFPVLKNLELFNFKFQTVKSVEINAPKLVKFRAWTCRNDSLIKIVAPKLIEFEVSELEKYDLCAPSLLCADLMGDDASRVTTFLKGVPCLTYLSITYSMAKAILQWKGVNTITCLERLQTLSVRGSISKDIVDLFQLTPNLQSLNLTGFHHRKLQQYLRLEGIDTLPCLERLQELSVRFSSTKDVLDLLHLTPNLQSLNFDQVLCETLEQPSTLPPCIVSQLKQVTIYDFSGDSDSVQISLANFFVEKATKLERVLVYLRKGLLMTDENIVCWQATLGPESLIQLSVEQE